MSRFLPTLAELESLPTLVAGQADDLRVEVLGGPRSYRVWLSRCGITDGQPVEHMATVEEMVNGQWQVTCSYDAETMEEL